MIMSFKRMFRELREMREGSKNKLRRTSEKKCLHCHGRSHIAPEISSSPLELVEGNSWENFPSELLLDIIQRLESTQTLWPARRDVVACASVCRSWRETTKEVVRTPEQCGLITFPISLKQPGPRDSLIQCYIKRDRVTSTYSLYLGLSPALSEDVSKLLLAAKKIRKATSTDFRISLATNDFSQSNHAYIGKLRSNFLGSKFSIYDSQRLCDHAIRSNGRSHRKRNYNVATISYELNVLRTKGPRRMLCTMNSIPTSAVQGGGIAPTVATFGNFLNEQCSPLSVSKGKNLVKFGSNSLTEPLEPVHDTRDPLILKNKAPRWHEQLQCWCLNFKGRVTVASVKNFQLVAAIEPCQNVPAAEQEKVMLQFGKIGKDIFTMDYRYPLSAFQAFAICLSSFDTKPT
ncbi:Tubby-like F-box protein 5 [Camellia lanceoleosa]|uniref:Tubby-like F-box protein 5 n=1 Tax=Camellia lanceoleosa TaxID=1840588 RepID=A0ACC0GS32_9ERIC|nr:Tubby-like F-box protein 5 [Camellia lanceoleosa]